MSEIKLKENESLDNALKRFKRQCAKSGVMSELRKREHYDKPSVKRKKKSEAARKRKFRQKFKRHPELQNRNASFFVIQKNKGGVCYVIEGYVYGRNESCYEGEG